MFTSKTRVAFKNASKIPFARGTTVNHSDLLTGFVIVEWDDGRLTKTDVQKLILESDALAEEQLVQEAASLAKKKAAEEKARKEAAKARLEAEFDSVKNQMNLKLNEAADILNEAIALANKYNKDLYNDLDTEALFDAIDNAGWSSSRC